MNVESVQYAAVTVHFHWPCSNELCQQWQQWYFESFFYNWQYMLHDAGMGV